MPKDYFVGKNVLLIGDSITAGVGTDKTYGAYLAESLGVSIINKGVSGSGYCSGGAMKTNQTLTEANVRNADIVTIMLGVNDWDWAVKDGSWRGNPNYYDKSQTYYQLGEFNSTDTSTFYGALHSWCQNIISMKQTAGFEDKQFIVFTPLITSWNVSVGKTNDWNQDKLNIHGHRFREYCTAIMEVCAYYGIPVFDANMFSGIYYRSATDNNVAETGGDGVHINAIGHALLAQSLEEFLLEGYSYEDREVEHGGHIYENGVCTDCRAKIPAETVKETYRGKVISILGDSISTFAGYIPTADGFNLEHLARYPQDNLLTDVNETWWMQIINELDAKLGINDSWRGATVSGYHPVTTGTTGENAAMGNLQRIRNLGANGTPDVILFYGGTNDLAHVAKVGSFDPETAPDTVDLVTKKWDNLADGYVNTLLRLQHFYPEATIIALLPTYTNGYYSDAKLAEGNAVLAEICEHYGVTYVDLRDCGISTADLPDNIHPNAKGMDFITEAVLEALMDEYDMAAGENIVHSVTHELKNASSSLGYYKGVSHGKSFCAAITGEDLTVTVTMGGLDVTDTVYQNGVVNIASVTGDIVIHAEGRIKTIYEDHLQQLPDSICKDINLWDVLEPENTYYTGTAWGNLNTNQVWSVTFPVEADDQIWSSSFQKYGSNGNNYNKVDAIRVTWFSNTGVLKSVGAPEVYAEFSAKGYLSVPEGAVAVNVPMWNVSRDNSFYLLNRDHNYDNCQCSCGATLGPKITRQPVSVQANYGEPFTVTVEADGYGLTYQWYYKDAGMEEFVVSDNQTSSYTYTMQIELHDRQVYCVVTDAYGNQVTTETAIINCAQVFVASVKNTDGSIREFDTVDEAIQAAAPGDTVMLLKDVEIYCLIVPVDVDFDLNGNVLTADYVASFGNIVDSSQDNTGLLKVSEKKILLQKNNLQLPVGDPEGYRFVEVLKFNRKLYAENYKLVFQPLFEEAAHPYILQGKELTGLTVGVKISCQETQGARSQLFTYNDTQITQFIQSYKGPGTGSYKSMFTLTLTGAENLQDLQFQIVVKSETGVEILSDPILYPQA